QGISSDRGAPARSASRRRGSPLIGTFCGSKRLSGLVRRRQGILADRQVEARLDATVSTGRAVALEGPGGSGLSLQRLGKVSGKRGHQFASNLRPSASRRPAATTRAPSVTNLSVIRSPIPLVAPVTIATFPLSWAIDTPCWPPAAINGTEFL